jgi:hypothetical protein
MSDIDMIDNNLGSQQEEKKQQPFVGDGPCKSSLCPFAFQQVIQNNCELQKIVELFVNLRHAALTESTADVPVYDVEQFWLGPQHRTEFLAFLLKLLQEEEEESEQLQQQLQQQQQQCQQQATNDQSDRISQLNTWIVQLTKVLKEADQPFTVFSNWMRSPHQRVLDECNLLGFILESATVNVGILKLLLAQHVEVYGYANDRSYIYLYAGTRKQQHNGTTTTASAWKRYDAVELLLARHWLLAREIAHPTVAEALLLVLTSNHSSGCIPRHHLVWFCENVRHFRVAELAILQVMIERSKCPEELFRIVIDSTCDESFVDAWTLLLKHSMSHFILQKKRLMSSYGASTVLCHLVRLHHAQTVQGNTHLQIICRKMFMMLFEQQLELHDAEVTQSHSIELLAELQKHPRSQYKFSSLGCWRAPGNDDNSSCRHIVPFAHTSMQGVYDSLFQNLPDFDCAAAEPGGKAFCDLLSMVLDCSQRAEARFRDAIVKLIAIEEYSSQAQAVQSSFNFLAEQLGNALQVLAISIETLVDKRPRAVLQANQPWRLKAFQMLLENGADVNSCNHYYSGSTPLYNFTALLDTSLARVHYNGISFTIAFPYIKLLVEHPHISTETLMQHIPAPAHDLAARILGLSIFLSCGQGVKEEEALQCAQLWIRKIRQGCTNSPQRAIRFFYKVAGTVWVRPEMRTLVIEQIAEVLMTFQDSLQSNHTLPEKMEQVVNNVLIQTQQQQEDAKGDEKEEAKEDKKEAAKTKDDVVTLLTEIVAHFTATHHTELIVQLLNAYHNRLMQRNFVQANPFATLVSAFL